MVEFALQMHDKKDNQLNTDVQAPRVPDMGELIVTKDTTYTVTGVHWFLSNGSLMNPVVLAEEQ